MIENSKLSNLIKLLDAHTIVNIWEDDNRDNPIYSCEVWELYLIVETKRFDGYYIKDMMINYDGIRVIIYKKDK